jgi:acyl carrier protein
VALDYSQFSFQVCKLLQMPEAHPINRYAGLYDDVGLDSLQAFELLIIIESLAGLDTPPAEIPAIFTMDDAFRYYGDCVAAAAAS